MLLVWGQGTFTLQYNKQTEDFYLEQLVKKYASWETKLPYPLDNYADWMSTDGSAQNVANYYAGKQVEPSCAPCIDIMANSASVYAPDGTFTYFEPTPTKNATATYELWEGEFE